MAQPVHDPQVLRAIAHPVRNRILGELVAQGSLRAADLARELDIPANQASFHLRQLAKYGLIEEDPDAARDRRDRVWRAVEHRGYSVNLRDLEKQPGGEAASGVFRRNAAAWGQVVVQSVLEAPEPGTHSLSETAVRLTRDEARELARELDRVVGSWLDRNRGLDDERTAERRTYLYYCAVLPYPGSSGPEDNDRGDEGDLEDEGDEADEGTEA